MSYQAYIDTIKAKTGLTIEDFRKLAKAKNLTAYPELLAWAKSEYGLGHGHANVVAHEVMGEGKPRASVDEAIDKHFKGDKAVWREFYDQLMSELKQFGDDVRTAPTSSYISFLRGDKKFGIIQIVKDRVDIGIKLKGEAFTDEYTDATKWNPMVTHKATFTSPEANTGDVLNWLKQAYSKAI